MSKRFKLKKYIAGRSIKQSMGSIIQGDNLESSENNTGTELIKSKLYIAGWTGEIADGAQIIIDKTFYDSHYFYRKYAEQNDQLNPEYVNLDMKPTLAEITDIGQFGDFAFNLTDETISGTLYSLKTNPRQVETTWYCEPHELATYPLIPNPITEENKNDHYGATVSDNIISTLTPTLNNIIDKQYADNKLGFAYILEQNLNNKFGINPINSVYGFTEMRPVSVPIALTPDTSINSLYDPEALGGDDDSIYAIETIVMKPFTVVFSPEPESATSLSTSNRRNALYSTDNEVIDAYNSLFYNPFKLKNMYNYNFNTEYNNSYEMTGLRTYNRIGNTQNTIWLSYKYLREIPTNIQEYEFVERTKGLFKYIPKAHHKSNIYSIDVIDSGINENIEIPAGSNTDPLQDRDTIIAIKQSIQDMAKNIIKESILKISPIDTQIWKINFIGN